jgi:DNA processing protein
MEELSHAIKAPEGNDRTINEATESIPLLSPEESPVFNALGPYPVHIDDLVRKLSMEPGKLSSVLLQLELKGTVQQSPGKLFSLAAKE